MARKLDPRITAHPVRLLISMSYYIEHTCLHGSHRIVCAVSHSGTGEHELPYHDVVVQDENLRSNITPAPDGHGSQPLYTQGRTFAN